MRRLAVLAVLACAACPDEGGVPASVPGARQPEMVLALRDRGGAALATDARWLAIATWHAVSRVEKATGEVTELHVEPTGGIVTSAIAMDAESVYFVVRGACRDELARAAECASIRAVRLDGGAARRVLDLARGEEAPHVLAVDAQSVHFAGKSRVMRVAKAGGAADIEAEAEGRVRGLAVDGEHVYYNDATSLVSRSEGEGRRVVGRVDADGRVAIALDRASVYWIADDRVWRVAKTGGVPEVIGEALEDAHLAADDEGLAWTEPLEQAIALRRREGQVGRARLRDARPDDVALDARYAFASVVDLKDGSARVVRVPR
jgi:hypothetical protein